jgi:hypothetical protein
MKLHFIDIYIFFFFFVTSRNILIKKLLLLYEALLITIIIIKVKQLHDIVLITHGMIFCCCLWISLVFILF